MALITILLPSPPHPHEKPPQRLIPPDTGDFEELAILKKFANDVLNWDINNLQYTSLYIRRSYNTVFWMYVFLFIVGIGTAIAAIVRGFLAQNAGEAIPSLIFAGLSAASFFTLFITRPLESLERNTFFSSWLIAITNNYWLRLMYFDDPKTIETDLQDATDKFTDELGKLADKYAAAIGKYPALTGTTAGGGGNQPGGGSGGNQPGGGGKQPGGGNQPGGGGKQPGGGNQPGGGGKQPGGGN